MVKYGANGQFILTGASNGMPCGLWYGSDPAPGQAKHCFYSASNGTQAVGPPGYTYCAPQGGTCDFSGPGTIVYGYAGAFTTPIQTVGPVGCGDNFGDPAPGTVKACFYSTGTSVTRTEIYAGSRHLATYDGGSTYFVHTDWLGTERARTDFQGNLCQTTATLPYGDLISLPPAGPALSSNCAPSDNLFTGKERDAESGLDYFGARYYASSMGRWMSPDWSKYPEPVPYASLGNPQSLNLYTYVSNNPLRFNDPNGHHQECAPDTSSTGKDGSITVTAGACHEVPDWWRFQGARRFLGRHKTAVKVTANVVIGVTAISGVFDAGASEAAVPAEIALEEAILEGGAEVAEVLTNKAAGEIIGWGTGQAAEGEGVAITQRLTATITEQDVAGMEAKGLNRATVDKLINVYEKAKASGVTNDQAGPRLELMQKISQLMKK